MQQKKIIFLASDCESSRWVYHALAKDMSFEAVILEKPVSRKELVKKRIKKIGVLPVAGQILFSAVVVPFLKFASRKRKAALVNQYHLNSNSITHDRIFQVKSVNDEPCLDIIRTLNPDLVIVNGTRIISKKILQGCNGLFINMHAGITPYYRGSHGGYWAVHNHDIIHFGTTIHQVDAGVDTGGVFKQVFTTPDKQDNFATYPVLQTAIGISALQEVIPGILNGTCRALPHTDKGKMYYQPSLWQYFGRLFQ